MAGDLWLLGDHRLLCGDATSPQDVARLMGGGLDAAMFTDPPWNVGIGQDSNPRHRQREGLQNDNLGPEEVDQSMLRLRDRWVWDLWLARTDGDYHMYFLQAPKALGDPDLRHKHASIGHAVSRDLISWTILPDAIVPGLTQAWDDLATWTESVIEEGGVWHMLYTGVSSVEGGLVQRIGLATSSDLINWNKHPGNPVMVADMRWYEGLDRTAWRELAWRDPWVFRDPEGQGFHALITARASSGRPDERGVIGHATSDDLITWTVLPPLSKPGAFGHLEVPQVEVVDGAALLVFSVGAADVSEQRRRHGTVATATYVTQTGSLLGPFDPATARPVTVPHLYSGRLVQQRDGSWVMLGFVDGDGQTGFVGEIGDPIPIGRLGVGDLAGPREGAER